MIPSELIRKLSDSGVVAVVTVADAADAVPIARALSAGGVTAIELTFRTPVAAEAIRTIRQEVPEVTVGAGTLLNPRQVAEAVKAGAHFGVSPGCNPWTLQAARDNGLPFAPGVMTPTDIEIAVSYNLNVLKYFPAETAGGLVQLKTMAAPFLHLGIRFIPLGGINADGLQNYLSSRLVLCVGGSWLVTSEDASGKNWEAIRVRATAASKVVALERAKGNVPVS
jgi:2-dehydro-3-deoxyphosphogluconate aldolase/(4S)-4-hydroxy-2-oxoglutarate aldolase